MFLQKALCCDIVVLHHQNFSLLISFLCFDGWKRFYKFVNLLWLMFFVKVIMFRIIRRLLLNLRLKLFLLLEKINLSLQFMVLPLLLSDYPVQLRNLTIFLFNMFALFKNCLVLHRNHFNLVAPSYFFDGIEHLRNMTLSNRH